MATGFGGTVILGPASGAGFGAQIAALGDINGDGRTDFAVSAPAAANGHGDGLLAGAGDTFLFYGGTTDLAAQMDLAFQGGLAPDGTTFSVLQGDLAGGGLGRVLAPAGDINSDGFDDLIVGSGVYGPDARVAFVIYGAAGGLGAVVDLASAGGSRLTVQTGPAGTSAFCAEGAGDLNGDGFDDLLITNPVTGRAFVLFGDNDVHPATLDMDADFDTQKDTYTQVQQAFAGGDLNKDGMADLVLITAAGAAVVFGSSAMGGITRDMDNATFTGANGLRLTGLAQVLRVEGLADINGDGIGDLLIEGRVDAQSALTQSYVLFGRQSGFAASVDLAALDGLTGFVVVDTGISAGLGGRGDVNGDGLRDIVLANAHADAGGEVYLLFGTFGAQAATINPALLDGTNGYRLIGFPAGSLAGGGQISDVNGDGFGDVIFGMAGAGGGRGGAVVLYGGPARLAALDLADGAADGVIRYARLGDTLTFTNPAPVPIGGDGGTGTGLPTRLDDDLTGTLGADTVDLLAGNDSFAALSGNDFVTGNLGADQIFGDTGDDSLFGGQGDDRLFGGSGDDLLDGGAGRDLMVGSVGNDRFIVDHAGDSVEDVDDGGWDIVESAVSFTLSAQIEEVRLTGVAATDATGHGGANRISGNDQANLLRGLSGADTMEGGAGADTIEGGRDKDWMAGGDDAARDVFVFSNPKDSPRGAGRDIIRDFDRGEDVLDLRLIDPNRAKDGDQVFNGMSQTAQPNALWWVRNGDDLLLRGDVTGDRRADFEIRLSDLFRLNASDILL